MKSITYTYSGANAQGLSFPWSTSPQHPSNWTPEQIDLLFDNKLTSILGEGVAATKINNGWIGSLTEEGQGINTHKGYWLYFSESITKTINTEVINSTLFPDGSSQAYEIVNVNLKGRLHTGVNFVSYPFFEESPVMNLGGGNSGRGLADFDSRHVKNVFIMGHSGEVGAWANIGSVWAGTAAPLKPGRGYMVTLNEESTQNTTPSDISQIFRNPQSTSQISTAEGHYYGEIDFSSTKSQKPWRCDISPYPISMVNINFNAPMDHDGTMINSTSAPGNYGIRNVNGTQLYSSLFCNSNIAAEQRPIVWFGTDSYSDNAITELNIAGGKLQSIGFKQFPTAGTTAVVGTPGSPQGYQGGTMTLRTNSGVHGIPNDNSTHFRKFSGATGVRASALNKFLPVTYVSATDFKVHFPAGAWIYTEPGDISSPLGFSVTNLKWEARGMGLNTQWGNTPTTQLSWGGAGTPPTDITKDNIEVMPVNADGTGGSIVSVTGGEANGMAGGSGLDGTTTLTLSGVEFLPSYGMFLRLNWFSDTHTAYWMWYRGSDALGPEVNPMEGMSIAAGKDFKMRVYDPETQMIYAGRWVDSNGAELNPYPTGHNHNGDNATSQANAVAANWGNYFNIHGDGLVMTLKPEYAGIGIKCVEIAADGSN